MKIVKSSAVLICVTLIGSNAYAGCAATAGFDKVMAEYDLAELSQSLQDNISKLSKDCKTALHTGKVMNSIGSCNEALKIAGDSS